ncbi:MAG: hypothetical protein ACI837_000201 [Crocinitomicaceae bacterium]|jgi:hypothetical protein
MNKFLLTSLFATIACTVFVSCGNIQPIIEVPIDDELPDITKGRVALDLISPDLADTAESVISYQFYTSTDKSYKDSVNCIVKNFVHENADMVGSELIDCTLSGAYFEKQLNNFAAVYSSEAADDMNQFGIWSLEMDTYIEEERKEFIEVFMHVWVYSGGAHGNSYSTVSLIDKNTGVSLYLEDFFSDIDALDAIADPIFRQDQGLMYDEDLSDAGFWFDEGRFHVNSNFSFNGQSITFSFNPYEIASYAAGSIDVTIPIEQIKHLLKRSID